MLPTHINVNARRLIAFAILSLWLRNPTYYRRNYTAQIVFTYRFFATPLRRLDYSPLIPLISSLRDFGYYTILEPLLAMVLPPRIERGHRVLQTRALPFKLKKQVKYR